MSQNELHDREIYIVNIEIEPFRYPGTRKAVRLPCGSRLPGSFSETRPEPAAELEPGIFYIDLERLNDAAWKEWLPRLYEAKGILFDVRGYPEFSVAVDALAHLTRTEILPGRGRIPTPSKPDRIDLTFAETGGIGVLRPKAPSFKARSLPHRRARDQRRRDGDGHGGGLQARGNRGPADRGYQRRNQPVQTAGWIFRGLGWGSGVEA